MADLYKLVYSLRLVDRQINYKSFFYEEKMKSIQKHFTIISNKIINDSNLSAGAKGVACYLMSKEDLENWNYKIIDIKNHFKESIYAIRKFIKELETVGFLKRTLSNKIINGRNSFNWEYEFNEDYIFNVKEDTNSINNNCINKNCITPNSNNAKSKDILILNNTNTEYNNTEYNKKEINKEKKDFSLDDVEEEYKPLVEEWIAYKKEQFKFKYKSIGLKKFYNDLKNFSNNDISLAQQIIDRSIANGYSGIYQLKNNNQSYKKEIDYTNIPW